MKRIATNEEAVPIVSYGDCLEKESLYQWFQDGGSTGFRDEIGGCGRNENIQPGFLR